tara:strand:- start:283 stop:480 length:198 start_codon:yes stop_codon:yes gene_type:complete
MNITSATYDKPRDDNGNIIADENNCSIIAVCDGITMSVPLTSGNRHYDEIMRQVAAGELTIADAD